MSWNIRVWHEENDEAVRLIVEAGVDVPEDVISSVAGSYWLEEVQQYDEGPWDEDEMPSGGLHG
jgi:hypothetical protein